MTEIGKVDEMLSTRNSLQTEPYRFKKSALDILISGKVDFKENKITRYK